MNLHRATRTPDWHNIAHDRQNIFQRIAARSGGIVTPANIITLIGLGLVIAGLGAVLGGHVWTGLILLVVGRLLDIVDGMVAEATETKSTLGELCDAVADKLGTLLTVAVLIWADIAAWWWIAALVAPQVIILVIVTYKKRRSVRLHPTRAGKLSMAGVWLAVAGLLIAAATQSNTIMLLASVIIGLSIGLGLYTAYQYAREDVD